MKSYYRWYVTVVCFLFLLFHQADKLLLAPLVTPIMSEFQINEAQMGAVSSLAILVSALLYPLWGYLYDRFARAKLLSLASLIWGLTTSLSAVAPNFSTFMLTRASTGIDDSSYPGLFSLLSDYFEPKLRGKVYGVLQMSGPVGFMLGTVLATMLGSSIGWRNVFFITGGVGIVIAVLIYITVKEMPRGGADPEMQGIDEDADIKFNWSSARDLFRNRSLLLLMAQGFFGVFPWYILSFWFFRYLETERGYTPTEAMGVMIVAIVALSAGYYIGGSLGDALFQRFSSGRIVAGTIGVISGAILLYFTMIVPLGQTVPFLILLGFTSIAMSMASPNVIASVFDITVPEVRSSAQAIRKLLEDGGAAAAPFLAGLIAMRYSLHSAIVIICIGAWVICTIVFAVLIHHIPKDIEKLHQIMEERARVETQP
jgi:predicted MFS family arabinose efflux permease